MAQKPNAYLDITIEKHHILIWKKNNAMEKSTELYVKHILFYQVV